MIKTSCLGSAVTSRKNFGQHTEQRRESKIHIDPNYCEILRLGVSERFKVSDIIHS